MEKKANFFIMSPTVLSKIADALDLVTAEDDIVREAKALLIGKSTVTQIGSLGGVPIYLDENMADDQILMGYGRS
jgi:hypothetical protein